jgi:AbrB family looped-hinge helix DNA binding protein
MCRSEPPFGSAPPGTTRLSLLRLVGKEAVVDAAAKVTSKGQVTVPKAVRDALGIKEGDEVVFRVEGNRAVLARTPDFLALAGKIRVPAAKRNVAWDEVIRRTRSDRAATRR